MPDYSDVDEMDNHRYYRINFDYSLAKEEVIKLQGIISFFNKEIEKSDTPADRRELKDKRKAYTAQLQRAQDKCGKLKPKVNAAGREVHSYFIDLMREEILGEDLFKKYWIEAINMKDRAVLEAGEDET